MVWGRAKRRSAKVSEVTLNSLTLCFANVGVERGFLASRQDQLAGNLFLMALLAGFYVSTLLVLVLLDWDTSGEQFRPVHSQVHQRMVLCRNLLLIMSLLTCLFAMVIARSRHLRACVGLNGLEYTAVASVNLMIILATLSFPWCTASIFHLDPSQAALHIDTKGLFILLNALITGSHMGLPVRCLFLWPTDVVVLLCYGTAVFCWSSNAKIENIKDLALLALLTTAAAMGRRQIERLERIAFAKVAAEKSLRFQVEHQLGKITMESADMAAELSGIGRLQRRVREIPDCNVSIPTTKGTDQMFDSLEELTVEAAKMRLEELAALGYSEHWLVPASELQPRPDCVLGIGGFGLVMAARYHGAMVVLKAPRTSQSATHVRSLASIAHELRIFRRLHHPNIVLFYGACIEPAGSEILLVLEYLRGKPLDEIIRAPPAYPPTIERLMIANDVGCALRYLHAQRPCGIIHGDIKGSNVLVEQNERGPRAKLVDFGLGRLITKASKPLGGTVNWMAPEVLLGCCPPAPSADVFSFGRLLYMVVTGRMPLPGVSEEIMNMAQDVTDQALVWPENVPLRDECRDLAGRCNRLDPEKRPSMTEVQKIIRGLFFSASSSGDNFHETEESSLSWMQDSPNPWHGIQTALQKVREKFDPLHPQQRPAYSVSMGHGHSRELEEGRSDCDFSSGSWASRDGRQPPPIQWSIDVAEKGRDDEVIRLLRGWNLPEDSFGRHSCCAFHAIVAELQRTGSRLQARPCCESWPHDASKAPSDSPASEARDVAAPSTRKDVVQL
mmetsp:Transcript_146612/g.470398  ORF Transcript_146612/g.470398 Transcript_146612/m.470398 type:complete len:785 (-) Transcript_146612:260-2614(-)|eukprot:CAMPEP_0203839234 /NCGR_PEP_ID=MMETSP0359-20131031/49_1 /ASSEMBLY_ACC=CAM_ASM_000338 /TAXON_ID=268821 /ORGANISM="Scrippsiella Hangoei, Strain SHTV-5" /LENGTH=784 /DNA_ID=CAMNT_0050753229 /DNA_START=24 /DNA_END=2378 /DNA_ORIENTATION=-